MFAKIQPHTDRQELQQHANQLQRMCAAMRATLEQHVKAEEQELWPLFTEHFTAEEQQHLVGMIIGRSGAEVLQAMLPWVTGTLSSTCDAAAALLLLTQHAAASATCTAAVNMHNFCPVALPLGPC